MENLLTKRAGWISMGCLCGACSYTAGGLALVGTGVSTAALATIIKTFHT
jgi:hypothetical protein